MVVLALLPPVDANLKPPPVLFCLLVNGPKNPEPFPELLLFEFGKDGPLPNDKDGAAAGNKPDGGGLLFGGIPVENILFPTLEEERKENPELAGLLGFGFDFKLKLTPVLEFAGKVGLFEVEPMYGKKDVVDLGLLLWLLF